jgi:hypothetical protein
MDKLQEQRSEIVQLLKEFCAAIEMPVEELEDDDLLLPGPFAYGMLLAFGRVHGLDDSEVRALAPDIFHDVFQYAEDQAESVADFLTEAASDLSNQPSHAIIQHGVEGYDQCGVFCLRSWKTHTWTVTTDASSFSNCSRSTKRATSPVAGEEDGPKGSWSSSDGPPVDRVFV